MQVIIGSTSRSKLEATKTIFYQILGHEIVVVSKSTDSNVAAAPWDEDTLQGARTRANACFVANEGDYFVGIESGLTKRYGTFFEETWAVILNKDKEEFLGYSSGLPLPPFVIEIMRKHDLTHDKAMEYIDELLDNVEASTNHDTWHTYSGGQIVRSIAFEEALRNALTQIVATERSLYKKQA